ncbi:MAG: VCBS repeat-containing protein [Ferruginibacter sp.]|nr:VCBS repeat-containing protein [Ferruginibacter sp.]
MKFSPKLLPSSIIFFSIFYLSSCNNKHTLFLQIPSSQSGINFNNTITETDSINPMDIVNIYNGGGVGIGDFNKDGLQDIFFTGNMVPCKLYLNKGNLKFEDITEKAGVAGLGRWARGASVIDINNDGLMDIYICNTVYPDSTRRTNILYINQGVDKEGIPHFKDMAADYGLNNKNQSTMPIFFDYDNDGDLDMYLTVNTASSSDQNKFGKSGGGNNNSDAKSSKGRLYRNAWDAQLNHPVFQDVSLQAGITLNGFGHGATVADINGDGWKDIYVSNDFLSDNILYINNKDGTFTNRSKEYFKHTSFNAMGQDIIDINNDGLSDVVELDMNPKDNYRKKMMLGANNYNTFQNFGVYGNQIQYVRNTLQLNQGSTIFENDSIGHPVFSEIGFMSGISQTDWSWTPLIVDFDNDGYRDMVITNGFPKDVTDHDFIAYRKQLIINQSPIQMIGKIPEVKLANYAFRNTDGISFNDVTASWGLTTPSFSNGAAYADFDNDGDMDMVINNINDEAFLYENTTRKKGDSTTHYLQVKCTGSKQNINGIGAWIDIYYDGNKHQAYENTPYRGYLSTDQNIAHFGLGKTTIIDSVVIRWPDYKKQIITKVSSDQLLQVNIEVAKDIYSWQPNQLLQKPLFAEITKAAAIDYTNADQDEIDFNQQTTLPHKLSEYNPAIAVGDIDGNGFDDMIVAGNSSAPATIFLQQGNGKFIKKPLEDNQHQTLVQTKDEGLLLFDANGDGFLDLYVSSGGYKYEHNSANYQDKIFINDGKGNFTLALNALPVNYTSKLCVKAMDYNKDGKLDLFVSGRVDPWNYPKPVSSFIFRNDSENGKIKFTDVTEDVAPALKNIGMVCDAIFTDFDNDGQIDLILAGEWMPVTFLKNDQGKFTNVTKATGIEGKAGWWNSIVAGDFRHTGKIDYIVGNVGLNTLYQPTEAYPVYVTAKDFDHNGGYVPITSLFLPAKNGGLNEFPANGRDEIIERIPTLRKRFNTYNAFASASMQDILTPELGKDAQRLKATLLQSCYIRNDGNGKFSIIPLPKQAQVSVLNGMVVDDFDGDGNLDVLINGNDFGTDVSIGRFDALNGLLLKGNGQGAFSPLSILQSGIYIPGNGKALVKMRGAANNYLVAASQNKSDLKLFKLNKKVNTIPINPDDRSAIKTFNNGSIQKEEFYYGNSFLSQSARFITVDENIKTITITNNKGIERILKINFTK